MVVKFIQFFVIFLNLLLGIFVFSQKGKLRDNRIFLFLSLLATLWTLANYMTTISLSLIWWQISYALGALLISSGLIWVFSITDKLSRKKWVVTTSFALLISVSCFLPQFITKYFDAATGTLIDPGWGLPYYTTFYIFITLRLLWELYEARKQSNNSTKKKQLETIFWGSLITLCITTLSSFILPYFSIFPFDGVDNIGFLIFLIFITYAITKHHLFNIRVITVELITVGLWVIILARIFIAKNINEILIELGVLLISILIGLILIRSTLKEITQREQIQQLANKLQTLNSSLESKVAEQTIEIRKAYDLEKKARRELEKLNETKDQFIMITQHHLRTPVTTITWSLEAMLKGDYGVLTPSLIKVLETSKSAARRLTRIVDDFLSITAIKIGTQILHISPSRMKPLLEDVISELQMDIQNMNVAISYPADESSWPVLAIDSDRMREVLLIIMENAVRYNYKHGTIFITTRTENDVFEMIVKNTGIGIEPADCEKIFNSLFHRGSEARKAHALGMGVGLSVSRAIVRAHKGNIKIESEGSGKGAMLLISLPLTR